MDTSLQKSRTANPGEGRDSDFQKYHIIIFKWLVFRNNNEITKYAKKQENMAIERNKIN